jgi:polyhydroxybutyrate depolymerase
MGVRAPLIVLAGVLGVSAVAWSSGALAIHEAHAPTGCVALPAGNQNVRVGRRDVFVHVPPGTTGPLPLVLALHGAGLSGPRVALRTGFSRLADGGRFIVAYPSAVFLGPAPAATLRALETAACANRSRVFVVSPGATAGVGCALSGRVAGTALVTDGRRALPRCPAPRRRVLRIRGPERAASARAWAHFRAT